MKYEQVYDGEWNPLQKDWFHACCDCSLCHRVRIRITKKRGPEIQWTTDRRRTAQLRRWRRKQKK